MNLPCWREKLEQTVQNIVLEILSYPASSGSEERKLRCVDKLDFET